MNVANKQDAKAGLRTVAPLETKFLGVLLGTAPLSIAGYSARLIGAVGLAVVAGAITAFAAGWVSAGVVALVAGVAALSAVAATTKAAADGNWTLWWQIYVATHEGADVSSVIFDNPTPAWFAIEDDLITLDFPPTSAAVIHAGTRQRTEEALIAAWTPFLPAGTSVLLNWATSTRLQAHAAPTELPATQQELFRRSMTAAVHAATGHDLNYTLPFITVDVAFAKSERLAPVRLRAASTTSTELCSEYQRQTCQQVLEPLLTQHDPALRTYWTWTDLSVEALVLHPQDPQAHAHSHQQAFLAQLRTAVGYAHEDHISAVRIAGWDNGPTVVNIEMDRALTTPQVPAALSLHPRVLLARTYPDRAWMAPRVLDTPQGVLVSYQAVPRPTPAGADAARQTAAESALIALLPYGDHAWVEASTTDGQRTSTTFLIHTDRLLDEYWRESTTAAIGSALPGSEIYFDIPTRRLAIRN